MECNQFRIYMGAPTSSSALAYQYADEDVGAPMLRNNFWGLT